ncbi:hypothetical protein F9C07_5163 [Aspergillus flavus]|uniref:F5/8 type C domain-containing protein n=3 Tax=Aspergillus subgen. Circumdati TaxID=2720871 RepID=A0A7U2MWG6_ASPFN|nr:unnamed protein product [Aspergillus oryzae RIB40]XP_041149796.1 uncharacterized protein G4B84_010284 [Aspergillus flavus NRRL3357]OOO06526.1 protein of unknown function DUF1929 [Aspergillus oryzae]QRD91111.1 hypothetical protein F9C07_5163 [Aspergillus flavus]KAF7623652.1 hypothetical protein AFLA_007379 [Aspergillus flavus NRRL3357]QMW34793.1 hypothetical protein G4B84_010284 [Aspergillus flavus NRRL3357]BAE64583.1 unnamed protein product [Aspergillus oryzae RIB40]
MKFQWASGLLLGAATVDAFKPAEFSYESSEAECVEIAKSVTGEVKYQSPPPNSYLISKTNPEEPDENWVVQCSSQYRGYACDYAIDDRDDRYWLSNPADGETSEIVVDLRKKYLVSGLTMLPELNKNSKHGQIGEHRISVSQDGKTWTPVAYGTWGSNKSPKLSVFNPKLAQYVKLVSESQSLPDRTQKKHGQISIVNLSVYTYNGTDYPREDPSKGVWGPTIDLPIVPVSSAVEQHGDIIMWSAWADDQFFASPGGKTLTSTMNRDGIITQSEVFETKHDMFCPGTSMDIDGNIVVSGGADSGRTSVYNGTAWVKGPSMAIPRGYQSSTTLSDGRIFVIGGSWSGGDKVAKNGEVYYPYPDGNAVWETRPGCEVEPMMTDDRLGQWRADNHGWLFGWKKASVFQAGPSKEMHWYDVDDVSRDRNGRRRVRGSVHSAGLRGKDQDSMSGSAVMYDATKGKILTFGGQRHYDGSYGSKRAHLITIGEAYQRPVVKVAGKGPDGKGEGGMHEPRVFHTSVVLPDGKVFIAGGQTWGKPFHEDQIVFTPELYDPETDTFVQLSRNNIKRVYHSISMLLPNATVLNGGGGLCGNCSANHYDAEIFNPPYLFNPDGTRAVRPEITRMINGNVLTVGGAVTFETASEVESASLVRVGTTTHTVNTDQRRIPLDITHKGGNQYTADLPNDAGVILPGWYMLFAMNDQGTPSVAQMVKVELSSPPEWKTRQYAEEQAGELESEYRGDAHDCDHEEEVKGLISSMLASSSKFWNTWKPSLINQA